MQSSSLPLIRWEFAPLPACSEHRYTVIFRQWHRAHLLAPFGDDVVTSLEIGGRSSSPIELRRLNHWIRAGGAWRCSALPYWDASDVLCNVLLGHCPVLPVGSLGAGRAARAPVLPLRWYQPQHLQGEFRLEGLDLSNPSRRILRRLHVSGFSNALKISANLIINIRCKLAFHRFL